VARQQKLALHYISRSVKTFLFFKSAKCAKGVKNGTLGRTIVQQLWGGEGSAQCDNVQQGGRGQKCFKEDDVLYGWPLSWNVVAVVVRLASIGGVLFSLATAFFTMCKLNCACYEASCFAILRKIWPVVVCC